MFHFSSFRFYVKCSRQATPYPTPVPHRCFSVIICKIRVLPFDGSTGTIHMFIMQSFSFVRQRVRRDSRFLYILVARQDVFMSIFTHIIPVCFAVRHGRFHENSKTYIYMNKSVVPIACVASGTVHALLSGDVTALAVSLIFLTFTSWRGMYRAWLRMTQSSGKGGAR